MHIFVAQIWGGGGGEGGGGRKTPFLDIKIKI